MQEITDEKLDKLGITNRAYLSAASRRALAWKERGNEWFGEFYDTLQKALTTPNSVSETEFIGYLFTFAKIAALWILIAVFTGFLAFVV